MDNTLREHILNLENRIQALSDQSTKPRRKASERDQIESEIQAARLALEYYRMAFSLEQEIASSRLSGKQTRSIF